MTQSVAAAVVLERGRVLLVRRRVAEGTLSWQFPAGNIENGESPATAVEWCDWHEVGERIPNGIYEPVQHRLDAVLDR